jgi:hypothetical protein
LEKLSNDKWYEYIGLYLHLCNMLKKLTRK